MKHKILIIEDEEISAIALEQLLISFGYEITDCVNNVEDALISIKKSKPDLIVSDIMIKGGISGCEFALQLQTHNDIPFIFVTAYFDKELLNYALDSNVHGYLLKPFNPNELEATVKITLNKTSKSSRESTIIKLDNFNYNTSTKEIIQNNVTVSIGKKSRILLELLLKNKNNTVPYEILTGILYNSTLPQDIDKLRHLVKRLKEKLDTQAIVSVKNIGYLIKTK